MKGNLPEYLKYVKKGTKIKCINSIADLKNGRIYTYAGAEFNRKGEPDDLLSVKELPFAEFFVSRFDLVDNVFIEEDTDLDLTATTIQVINYTSNSIIWNNVNNTVSL